jgi:hypothetical protein
VKWKKREEEEEEAEAAAAMVPKRPFPHRRVPGRTTTSLFQINENE